MFWPFIIDGSIRPFRIENGLKIDSRGYYVFPNKHFNLLKSVEQSSLLVYELCFFIPDNSLSVPSRYIN